MLNAHVDVGKLLEISIDERDTNSIGLKPVELIRDFAKKQRPPLEDIYVFAAQMRFNSERELNHRRTWLSFYGQPSVDEMAFQHEVWKQITRQLSTHLQLA